MTDVKKTMKDIQGTRKTITVVFRWLVEEKEKWSVGKNAEKRTKKKKKIDVRSGI